MDTTKWRILVVDDEEDVHAVTGLALKRRSWKGRPFELVGARSAAEAKKVLASSPPFHVALVDVVMETDHAGLDLCEYMRQSQSRATRIVLRTGQPGVAPEEKVLNDFDIDYYLAKSEVTQDRLYTTVRACLRSSIDVSTIMAVTDQLQDYVKVVQEDDSLDSLVASFAGTLGFLEQKYDAGLGIFTELAQEHRAECLGARMEAMTKDGKVNLADVRATAAAKKVGKVEFAAERGAGDVWYLPFTFVQRVTVGGASKGGILDSLTKLLGGSGGWVAAGCIAVRGDGLSEKVLNQLSYDLRLFCQNWKLAYQLLCTQKAITDAASGVVW